MVVYELQVCVDNPVRIRSTHSSLPSFSYLEKRGDEHRQEGKGNIFIAREVDLRRRRRPEYSRRGIVPEKKKKEVRMVKGPLGKIV